LSKFSINRGGFLRNSAGAATLGLAACAGGTSIGGGSPIPNDGTAATPGHTSAPGSGTTTPPAATPAPGSTATAPATSPTSTPGVGATASAVPYPSGSVSSGVRGPNSLPDSTRPAGTANASLPFEYVVVVMMENHSFDNYFGMLPLRGQPLADGFSFDSNGVPQNKNPLKGGYQHVFHLQGTCAPYEVTQAWDATHEQVNDGAMNGFAASCDTAMGYWDETDIPFYYSLAKTFCVGNRAFCSTQGQTYPNRRYLYAGTSGGLVSTSDSTFTMPAPANGTLMDVMTKYGVTWADYFTDEPALAIVPQTLENHPTNFFSIAQFFVDCAAGTLPNVSFIDPDFDTVGTVGSELFSYLQKIPDPPASIAAALAQDKEDTASLGESEENPQDIAIGEQFVAKVVNAVMSGPHWPKTLLIWTYDEHGGYYDHVVPLGAPEPDTIQPNISATDYQAKFNVTGVRVPTVVVSPYSRPNAVSNVPHDHTSIIATIAAKWNLPALTYRDAQANTLLDYLNLNGPPAFLVPPALAAPSLPADEGGSKCVEAPPPDTISPNVVRSRRN
jgi:phospholipase C